MKVFAIIPAAGLGTRMAGAAPAGRKPASAKQFAEIAGVPILIHTLRRFAACPEVSEIFVSLRPAEADAFRPRIDAERFATPIHLVEGGESRQESVGNALQRIRAADDDLVLVHDAVRPLVDLATIHSVIAAAQRYGAAIAALPASDTVKQVDRTAEGAIIVATIPRAGVVLAQTPQGFRYALLKRAFDEAQADGFTGTDEASLLERAGHEVAVVMGTPQNIKITTPADLQLAEFLLAREEGRSLAVQSSPATPHHG